MSGVVTLAAFRETLMHWLGMRQTVAIGTQRHGLVLCGVTGCTGYLAMLRLADRERRKSRIVAGSAKL